MPLAPGPHAPEEVEAAGVGVVFAVTAELGKAFAVVLVSRRFVSVRFMRESASAARVLEG